MDLDRYRKLCKAAKAEQAGREEWIDYSELAKKFAGW